MPDRTRRRPTPAELDREAEITPADVDRARSRVKSPLLRQLLEADVTPPPTPEPPPRHA